MGYFNADSVINLLMGSLLWNILLGKVRSKK